MSTDGFTTCLWFDDQAEEAATYYVSVFRDAELGRVTRHTEAGPGPSGSVLTVEFTLNGQRFLALNGGAQPWTFNESVSFQIPCETQEEVDHYWAALADGGQEIECGWLKDRYGLAWQVVPTRLPDWISDPDPQKAERAMKAMMSMKKFDIAALERAHAGA
jgi:predicted 3-demethylubiquinone-9 3-methyltransferase (glyoxalase superfamily)